MDSKRVFLVWISIVCCFIVVACDEYKTIETTNGLVRGRRGTTLLNNISHYSFKGIPYAKPPVGDLRLKAPEPAESWKPETFDAFDHSKICMQSGYLVSLPFSQSEDCLTLNIYVPADVKPEEKLAVVFYVHGGGYVDGASNDFVNGNDFIIEKRVILVTINYRLGLFGFLSLDSPEFSGNMGLKDQQLALKWVSENIVRFGGDNKRITIFGHSAGGSSVHFHVISAGSQKYFRNALCMSGSTENYWALSETNDHLTLAYRIAEDLGQPQNSFDGLVRFLHSLEADTLSPYSRMNSTFGRLDIPILPVIERRDAVHPFLVDQPNINYETTKMEANVMFSFASLEILGMIANSRQFPTLKELNTNFRVGLPYRGVNLDPDSEKYQSLTSQIRHSYFGNDTIDEHALYEYIALFSDINFAHGVDKSAKFHASKSKGKTFYYRFSVDSKLNIYKRNNPIYLPGAAHADEHCYVFRCGMAQPIYDDIINHKTDEQSLISLRAIDSITKIITNFAKYDEPSHQNDPVEGFQPIQNDAVHFLDITNEGLIPGLSPNKKANDLWASIDQQIQDD